MSTPSSNQEFFAQLPQAKTLNLREGFLWFFATESDCQQFSDFIDQSVQKLKPAVSQAYLMEERIQILNRYFFEELGFAFDRQDPLGKNPDNVHLVRVIERRKGFCLSLSLLYLVVGLELQLPLYGVKAPNHFFLRCEENTEGFINIEPTNSGLPLPNSHYVEKLKIDSKSLMQEYYLRNLTRKEVFAEYLSNYLVLWPPPEGISVLELYQYAVECSPQSPEIHLNYANTLYEHNRLKEALSLYDRAVELNASNPEVFSQRAVVYGKLGEFPQALKDFEVALTLEPNYFPALWNRALAFHKNQNFDFAEQDYLSVLKQNSKYAGAHHNLAVLYSETNDWEQARKHGEEAVYLEPANIKYQETLKKIVHFQRQTFK
ncbi:MAG: transglutaminase family protein [Planctomycetota bacterium]